MPGFKRNGHLVQSKVQRDVLVRFILHWCALAVTFVSIVFCMHFFLGDPGDGAQSILRQMWHRYSLLAVVSFSLVPYFVYDMIKLTHRFAGPMVRFGNSLQRAARGEHVEPIKFRDGDYWQELADDFNVVMARVQGDKQKAEEIMLAVARSQQEEQEESEKLVTA